MTAKSNRTAHRNPAKVLMLGASPRNRGGIASVEALLLEYWGHDLYNVRHVATLVNASVITKFLTALRAFFVFIGHLMVWRPSLVHVHFASNASFYRKSLFILLGRLLRFPLLLHCHASNFDVFFGGSGPIAQRYIRFILRLADAIVLLSRQWQDYFATLDLDVPLYVLPNPVRCPEEAPRRDPDGELVVLTLGRLGARKGTYDTLKAIPDVLRQRPEIEFWFGGDGEVEKVSRIVADHDLQKNVKLLGWVRGAEKERVLREAGVFLLPSYHEGLPVAILEAMAYGLPVISTPVGGIPEAVEEGEVGFLVPPGDVEAIADRVAFLAQHPDVRQKMGEEARRVAAERFEVTMVLEQLYGLYASVLN